jgi:hypothetical protein
MMVALYDVCLMVRRAFVVVVSTAGGVTVFVGVTVVDGLVTVLGSKTVVIVCVAVSVAAYRSQYTMYLKKEEGYLYLLEIGVTDATTVTVGVYYSDMSVFGLITQNSQTYGNSRLGSNREREVSLIGNLRSITVVRYDDDRPVAAIQLALHDRAISSQLCSSMLRSTDEPTMWIIDLCRPAAN